jgi:hypothetical protein
MSTKNNLIEDILNTEWNENNTEANIIRTNDI